jgi:general secretion pathway protein D
MTAKKLAGSAAVALIFWTSIGLAGSCSVETTLLLGAASLGQPAAADASAGNKREQADDLLRRARQAMAENDLPTAEKLISQASALGVDYGPFHFGDTPAKAMQDFERRRAAAVTRPSQTSSPQPFQQRAADPFAGRTDPRSPNAVTGSGQADGNGIPLTRLPPVGPAAQFPGLKPDTTTNPFGHATASMAPPTGNDDGLPAALRGRMPQADNAATAVTANQYLFAARRALAVGDVGRARGLVEQAKAIQAVRGPYDDVPQNVELLIRKHLELMAVPADRKGSDSFRLAYARLLLEQADGLLHRGDCDEAERLCIEANRQQVTYGALDTRPETLMQRIAAVRRQGPAAMVPAGALPMARQGAPSAVVPAGGQFVTPATGAADMDRRASRAWYDPSNDPTHNIPASSVQQSPAATLQEAMSPPAAAPEPASPMPATTPAAAAPAAAPGSMPAVAGNDPGMSLYMQGEAALRAHDRDNAVQYFRRAIAYRDQLDPRVVQRIQDYLQLSPMNAADQRTGALPPVDEATARKLALLKQFESDVHRDMSAAEATVNKDPQKALAMMEETRKKIESAGLDPGPRDQLLRRLDQRLKEMRDFVESRKPLLDLQTRNQRVREEVKERGEHRLDTQQKLAAMVEDFNRLMEDQRYAEAEVVAKRAEELDPQNPVVHQIVVDAKFARRIASNVALNDAKERGFWTSMDNVEHAAIGFDDNQPYQFGDFKTWKQMSERRGRALADRQHRRSERDMEIEQKLKTPVLLQFENAPLAKVMEYMGKLAQVNVYLDPEGLSEEGDTSDTPVTIKLESEISMKSALHLILQPLKLNYVIKDEVLKITSENKRDGELYLQTYYVADLVVPVPNFAVNPGMGMPGLIRDAINGQFGGGTGTPMGSQTPFSVVADKTGKGAGGVINPMIMAQMQQSGNLPRTPTGLGTAAAGTGNSPAAGNSGGLGGGAQADFESLIDLITSTVKPPSWETVGGPGSIAKFETNLSIVVSQTQEVHEEITDLLEQLRKLQDLQVTIEVRFITLSDDFFERVGVNFNFDLASNVDKKFQVFGQVQPGSTPNYSSNTAVGQSGNRDFTNRDLSGNQSVVVGLSAPTSFNADLDIPFTQGSYNLTAPSLNGAGFDPTAGATLGFAILSQIEAYFFIQAAQGDKRSNIMQSPKVTLFNGQQAYVSDTSQSPFVISVIPVVGDFAAAQQPVIVVLSEGTFLTVQAVVSNDRRFVRMTVVPFFSNIGPVNTFTFVGTTSTTQSTSAEGVVSNPTATSSSSATNSSGTTVQLPTFSFVTVTTTVSVPDGGTVLLGGIKRLSEQRIEDGVPVLDKIPYLSRLFKNTSIARTASSLMMMVTPRIIIQEEEEEKLGVTPAP